MQQPRIDNISRYSIFLPQRHHIGMLSDAHSTVKSATITMLAK